MDLRIQERRLLPEGFGCFLLARPPLAYDNTFHWKGYKSMQSHEVDYEIIGDDIQVVEVELDPGETVIAEAGDGAWGRNYRIMNSTTSNAGNSSATPHENRPPYYALAFIMRVE